MGKKSLQKVKVAKDSVTDLISFPETSTEKTVTQVPKRRR